MVDVSIWFLIATFLVTFFLAIKFGKSTFLDTVFKMVLCGIAGFCAYYLYTGKL